MRISKLKIKNLFGIREYEAGGSSVELVGANGTGKTSVLDAIRYALTNKSSRQYIIRNGESEGEILIETDTGLSIKRAPRTNKTDYKRVEQNGRAVESPESFLREFFTELQLNPIEFLQMSQQEQNRIVLDMIKFDWNLDWIKQQFGEIVPGVDYEQNILGVLHDIQAENGHYYQTRQNVSREAREKKAIIEDIAFAIPPKYDADHWESVDLGALYARIEKLSAENTAIDLAKSALTSIAAQISETEKALEVELQKNDVDHAALAANIDKEIADLEAKIRVLQVQKGGVEQSRSAAAKGIADTYAGKKDALIVEKSKQETIAAKQKTDTTDLTEEAGYSERMKKHINEYRRMREYQKQHDELIAYAQSLTDKIELARALPGKILETAEIPVPGLSVENGIPLINGLPISNLSEGEKMRLCVNIAARKEGALNILLLDGIEKLSSGNREALYSELKAAGIQFISTRTDDSSELTVIEL